MEVPSSAASRNLTTPTPLLRIPTGRRSSGGSFFGDESPENTDYNWRFTSSQDFLGSAKQTLRSGFGASGATAAGRGATASSGSRCSWHSNGRTRSAPLLLASSTTSCGTWYLKSSCEAGSPPRQAQWRPLGSTWRDWEADSHGERLRSNADDCRPFADGCVPKWTRGSIMHTKAILGHELAWAYYQMRRHRNHPLRLELGEMLPLKDLVGKMRDGQQNKFQFWRDLRPPFSVLEVKRVDPTGAHDLLADELGSQHPDGDIYNVVYECGIDYVGERLWGDKQDGGTFDNRIHGVAKIRIPYNFPEKRTLTILSWGSPSFNWSPPEEAKDESEGVDPEKWMPIAEELGIRADSPQLERCRSATREASRRLALQQKRGAEVPELQRMLLGPHKALPRLAAAEQRQATGESLSPERPKAKTRTIFTPASGFVRYAG